MRTEDLISQLASVAAPVRPLPAPAIRALSWCVAAVVAGGVAIALFGLRSDIGLVLVQPEFVWSLLVVLATGALAVTAALVLAIPGAERSAVLRRCTVGLVCLWAMTLIYGIIHTGHGFAGIADWPVCFARITAIALVPAFVLFVMVRRSAPLRLAWTSVLAVTAAIATGALAIQFICPLNDPGHALLGHFGPVLAIGALGAAAARRLLK